VYAAFLHAVVELWTFFEIAAALGGVAFLSGGVGICAWSVPWWLCPRWQFLVYGQWWMHTHVVRLTKSYKNEPFTLGP
jgi:hypothetical protein